MLKTRILQNLYHQTYRSYRNFTAVTLSKPISPVVISTRQKTWGNKTGKTSGVKKETNFKTITPSNLDFKYYFLGKVEGEEDAKNDSVFKGHSRLRFYESFGGLVHLAVFVFFLYTTTKAFLDLSTFTSKMSEYVSIDWGDGESDNDAGTGVGNEEVSLLDQLRAGQKKEKEMIPVEKPETKFEDVKGMSEVRVELEQVVEMLHDSDKYSAIGVKPPKGILLSGPPGCGKTLVGRAIAGECGLPFYFIPSAQVNGKYVGQGAKKIAKIFLEARQHEEGAIIFFDEIDSIGGKRNQDKVNQFSRLTINKLLNEMDGFNTDEKILVIASTNFPEVLDSALTRSGRFDLKIDIPRPSKEDRKELLEYYLSKVANTNAIDLEHFAKTTSSFSGADFKNVINTAAILATQSGQDLVDDELITQAIKKVKLGVPQLEKFKDIPEKDLKVEAYKQAGKIIAAKKIEDRRKIAFSTIMPRNNKIGVTVFTPLTYEDNIHKKDYLKQVGVYISERIVEDLITAEIFGVANPPGNTDTKGHTEQRKLLMSMVGDWGMGEGAAQIMFNTGVHRQWSRISPNLKNKILAEVDRLEKIETEKIEKVMRNNWDQVTLLATGLLEYETLSGKEINLILEKGNLECVKEQRDADAKLMKEKALERENLLLVDMSRVEKNSAEKDTSDESSKK